MGYHDLVFYWIFKNKYKTQQHIHKKSHQDSGDTQGIYKNRVEKEKLFFGHSRSFIFSFVKFSKEWSWCFEFSRSGFPNLQYFLLFFTFFRFYIYRHCR